jgi:short-subunit dehydrogenase
MKEPTSILITGASSGLGAALAQEFANYGVSLFLGGRNKRRLDAVANSCKARGASVTTASIDVSDMERINQWIKRIDETNPLDLVIANAAITGGIRQERYPEELKQATKILTVNLLGLINTIHPAIELMIPRRRGQIAIISSLAGYRGLPYSPAYSASKAALRVYGEAIKSVLAIHNIELCVVSPGFIDTPMNDTIVSPKPFMISPQKAARRIKKRLARSNSPYAFPLPLYLLTLLLTALPRRITDPILTKIPVQVSSHHARQPNDNQKRKI